MKPKLFFIFILIFFFCPFSQAQLLNLPGLGGKEEIHVQVNLVSSVESIQPGKPFWVALELLHDNHWHTYWHNPGEAGFPTTIEWELPSGFSASEFFWPVPVKFELSELVNYGYEGELLIPIKITPPEKLEADSIVSLKGNVNYLVCKDICLPGNEEVSLKLPVKETPPEANEKWDAKIKSVLENIPKELSQFEIKAVSSEGKIILNILPNAMVNPSPGDIYFFPFDEAQIAPSLPQNKKEANGYFALGTSSFRLSG